MKQLYDQDLKSKLIDFLIFYKGICEIKTDKELVKKYPDLKSFINKQFGEKNLISKTNVELKTYDFKKLSPDSHATD